MTPLDLYALFRSDVVDDVAPYLWSDTEAWSYMNDAYRMFVRKTGGVPDNTTTSITQIPIVAGQATAQVSPLILRFTSAYLLSNYATVKIISEPQLDKLVTTSDYGSTAVNVRSNTQGAVRYMVTGMDRNAARGIVRWVRVPQVNDTCMVGVMRLPVDVISENTADSMTTFPDIGEEHHEHLLLWMKHRAYGKQDAETFDRTKRDECKKEFEAYCAEAKAEWSRYKQQGESVTYGGL